MVRIKAMPTRPLAKSVAKVNIVERFQRWKRQEIFFCFVEGQLCTLRLLKTKFPELKLAFGRPARYADALTETHHIHKLDAPSGRECLRWGMFWGCEICFVVLVDLMLNLFAMFGRLNFVM